MATQTTHGTHSVIMTLSLMYVSTILSIFGTLLHLGNQICKCWLQKTHSLVSEAIIVYKTWYNYIWDNCICFCFADICPPSLCGELNDGEGENLDGMSLLCGNAVKTTLGRGKIAAISQTTFSDECSWLKMHEFRFRKVLINRITALVQIMAWRRPGDKPLSESMMVSFLTHICVTQLQ